MPNLSAGNPISLFAPLLELRVFVFSWTILFFTTLLKQIIQFLRIISLATSKAPCFVLTSLPLINPSIWRRREPLPCRSRWGGLCWGKSWTTESRWWPSKRSGHLQRKHNFTTWRKHGSLPRCGGGFMSITRYWSCASNRIIFSGYKFRPEVAHQGLDKYLRR